MSSERLAEAILLLMAAYGRAAPSLPTRRWSTLLEVVAGPPRSPSADAADVDLEVPEEVATAAPEMLRDVLKASGRNVRRTGPLQALAKWWPGDDAQESWWEAVEPRRRELAAIRGVGPELVDRLLLAVAGAPVVPLSRSALRLACRHGWCGLESEYEEWQYLYRQAAERAGVSIATADDLVSRVGRLHCGTTPRCDGCPLEGLLPEGGPYDPQYD